MKKIIFKTILLTVFLLNACITTMLGQIQVTRYTPNGSSVRAYNEISEMSSGDKEDWSDYVVTYYPQATELNSHSATTSYNCHAYAWHISEGGDNVWIGYYQGQETDEDIYWTDCSYIRQSVETGAKKISYYTGNHSAIQTSTNGIYKSKWGQGPLMQHAKNYGPSIYNMNYRRYYVRPYISGPTTVCTSNSTFTLNNLPPGATIKWTPSDNLSALIPNNEINYTVKAVSSTTSGSGWVQAVISGTGCGDITVSKDFWVGKPSITNAGTIGSCYEPIKIYKGPIIDGINYTWSVNNSDINLSTSNHVCYIDADIPDGSSEYFTLTLTISGNNCTTSNTKSGIYHKPTLCNCGYNHPSCGGSGGPPGILSVSPNPSDDYLEAILENLADEEYLNNEKLHIKLINNRSIPVYNGVTQQKKFQINTGSLPEGLYYLIVQYKNQKYTTTILISH